MNVATATADDRLTFDEATHTYRIDGAVVPSVTQIIQAVLPYQGPSDSWAMQRGTAMHHGCKLFDEKRLDWSTVHPEIEARIRAWDKFRRDLSVEIVVCEQPMFHSQYRYAGTIDRVFLSSSMGRLLCDIKSTITPQAYVQLGGYAAMLSDSEIPTDKACVVELHDDATYRVDWAERAELTAYKRVFLACLTVFGFKKFNNILEKS